MRVLPANFMYNGKSHSKVQKNSHPTFKTAEYNKILKEAMVTPIFKNEQVVSLFDKLLKAALSIKGVKEVNKTCITDLGCSFLGKMYALRNDSDNKVLLKKDNQAILEITCDQIMFNDIEKDREGVGFRMNSSKGYIVEMPYDKYCFYPHGNLERHTRYNYSYDGASTEYFDKNGEPREFRNLIDSLFGL